MNILIIEDNELLLLYYKMNFKNIDYAKYYNTAIKKASSKEYDYIFVDYTLDTDKSGVDFIEFIKDKTKARLIACSVDSDGNEFMMEAGAHEYIYKESKIEYINNLLNKHA